MVRVSVRFTARASLAGACRELAAGRTIARDETGKPRLAGSPAGIAWAHSHGAALAALAEDAELGVDLEMLRPVPDALDIARRQFAPAEAAWLAAQRDPDAAFLRLWTLKEAFLKATGEGLSRPLDSFTVRPGEGFGARLDGEPDWTLRSLAAPTGQVAAVAVRQRPVRVSFILLT